jgi:hypothetical protein
VRDELAVLLAISSAANNSAPMRQSLLAYVEEVFPGNTGTNRTASMLNAFAHAMASGDTALARAQGFK